MKLNTMRLSLLWLFIFVFSTPCLSEGQNTADTVVLTTDFIYKLQEGDSQEISRALALFGAEHKAVVLAAKYLIHKGLLEHYGKKQGEIFCLATNEIKAVIVDEKFEKATNAYYVKIKAEINSTDFIQAEIKNLELEKKEAEFSYGQEMEQQVIQAVDPGKELSRAYRYIRKGQWRIAIIYLNHLGKKYPHWGDIYLTKAIAFYSMHDRDRMMTALKKGCALDNQEACDDLKSLTDDRPQNGQ